MTPDYQRIAELEYELGFTDQPPPPRIQSAAAVDAVLKAAWEPRERVEVAWARQPIIQPPGELQDWMEADIDRKARQRESRSVRG